MSLTFRYLLLIVLLFNSIISFSQTQRNNHWLSKGSHINFTIFPADAETEPTNTLVSLLESSEGVSSISDENGQLILSADYCHVNYHKSDGTTIVSENISADSYSAQSVLLVPKPGSNTVYYLFQTTDWDVDGVAGNYTSGISYRILDISDPSNFQVGSSYEFDDHGNESVAAVEDDSGDYWIIYRTREWSDVENEEINTGQIKSIKLTSSGLDLAPTDIIDLDHEGSTYNIFGRITIAPQKNKIIVTSGIRVPPESSLIPLASTVESIDFNLSTGMFSNLTELRSYSDYPQAYGAAFTCDGNYAYFIEYTENGNGNLTKYDLFNNTVVNNSVPISSTLRNIKLGLYNNIYVVTSGQLFSFLPNNEASLETYPIGKQNLPNTVEYGLGCSCQIAITSAESTAASFCNGTDGGEITVNFNGNTSSYTCQLFDDLGNLQQQLDGISIFPYTCTFTNVPSGAYQVYVYATDEPTCHSELVEVTVESYQLEITSTIVGDPFCYGAGGGSLTVNTNGNADISSYTYQAVNITLGSSFQASSTSSDHTFTGLPHGTYQVYVYATNDADCNSGDFVEVEIRSYQDLACGTVDNITTCSNTLSFPLYITEIGTAPEYEPLPYTCEWTMEHNGVVSNTENCSNSLLNFPESGEYNLTIEINGDGNTCLSESLNSTITVLPFGTCNDCYGCVGSFAPQPDREYIVTAWVKEDVPGAIQYNNSVLNIDFLDQYENPLSNTDIDFTPSGKIIDGWQRIYGKFTIPTNAKNIKVALLHSGSGDSYFDDIKIQPIDASMVSYVYDPATGKLAAQLDENHYATFYEYDEEGKLIRIKKETERGIQTIQESREHIQKP